MKESEPLHNNIKKDKIPQKAQRVVFQLCTAVVKYCIKVTNASLSQNQSLQRVSLTLALMHACCNTATPLIDDSVIKLGDVH